MKRIFILVILLATLKINAQQKLKIGGSFGFQQSYRNSENTIMSGRVKVSSITGNDAGTFAGVFIEHQIQKKLSLRYELNMYKYFNTSIVSTKQDGTDYSVLPTTRYFALNNHFSTKYYINKWLFGSGGIAIQFNTMQSDSNNSLGDNIKYALILETVSKAISLNPVVFGSIVGIGTHVGRFNFQLFYQHNITNFNRARVEILGDDYILKEKSGIFFLSTSITLFRK